MAIRLPAFEVCNAVGEADCVVVGDRESSERFPDCQLLTVAPS
jgi:hypothetical protein